uniref:CesT family type III secretion system chaperone n=1 Tax=Candidatus Pantoea varia TaxID=1881036 RepID=UPI000B898F77
MTSVFPPQTAGGFSCSLPSKGCWLALDEEEQKRFCYQLPLAGFTPATFSALLLAFIEQVREMRM